MSVRETGKVINHFQMRLKARLWCFLGIGLEIIYARDAIKKFKPQARILLQEAADFDQVSGIDNDERIECLGLLGFDACTEFLFQEGDDLGGCHQRALPLNGGKKSL